jgi:ABC-type molybdate transport system substrate-binding protein
MSAPQRRFLALLGLFWLPAFEAAAALRVPEPEPQEITVLADEALRVPLTRMARSYAAAYNVTVTTWFSRTGEMTASLREGSEVDLVLTADPTVLKDLEYAGQIDVYATQPIATSPLVLALPEMEGGRGALDLLEWRYREEGALPLVLVEGPHRIEAPMTAQALTRSELLARTAIRRMPVGTVDEAVATMHTEGVAGLLLAVDVFSHPGLQVVQRFPPELVAPASFRAAVLAGEDMASARDFLKHVRSREAEPDWLAYGLTPVVPAASGRGEAR